MNKEEINIIKEQLYLENGNRASYIDISGEEADRFIEAVEKLLKENEELIDDNYNLDRENQLKFEKIIEENEELKKTIDELAKENEKWIDSGLDYVKRHFKDYIHKDKIRNKIKELEELFDKNEKEITIQYQNQFIVDVVGVLEELLGDDE